MGKGAVVILLIFLFVNTCLVGFGVANEDTLGHITTITSESDENPVTIINNGGEYELIENETYNIEGASEEKPTGILAFASTLLSNVQQFYILITSLLFAYSSIFVLLELPPLITWVLTVAVGLFEIYIIIDVLVSIVGAVRGVTGI